MEVLTDVISVNKKGVYRVQDGDTLDSLAVKYSTTKAILIFDNNLEKDIEIGDVLFIRTFKNVYEVSVLDTPFQVAKKLNTTVEKLYELNKIDYLCPYMRIIYEDF